MIPTKYINFVCLECKLFPEKNRKKSSWFLFSDIKPSVVSGGLAVTELAAAIEAGRPFATQLLESVPPVTVAGIAYAVEATSTPIALTQ